MFQAISRATYSYIVAVMPSLSHLLFALALAAGYFFCTHWDSTSGTIVENGYGESPTRYVTILLELEQPSVVELYAELTDDLRTGQDEAAEVAAARVSHATAVHLQLVEQEQVQMLDALAQLDASDVSVLYRVQRVYNGIAVRVAAEQVAQLASMPGVQALHNVVPKYPLNNRSVPHIGAPTLWQRNLPEELTGAGVTIAIIDTGIDYLHLDFGGPATGYGENDRTRIGDVGGFPGIKIARGYDFAGETYNADPEDSNFDPIPAPDPDPMDCYGLGHGTHVAGTAAGFGITRDRQTYRGSYTGALDFDSFLIGPGVAPHATLYALKVFGCSGASEIVDLGIEWAVDPNRDGDFSDHVDVINLSLGSSYGVTFDPTAIAAERATQVGVAVVASVGNDGDTYYTVSSPAVADHVISVAATASNYGMPGSSGPLFDTGTAFSSRGPRRRDSQLKPELAAPGQSIRSARVGDGDSSYLASGTSMAAPHVSGSLALLRQLYPDYGIQSADTISNWSVSDLKALLMNTAQTEIRASSALTSPQLNPVRVGAGNIDLVAATEDGVIVYNAEDPGLISVSFGAPAVVDHLYLVKNVYIENKGQQPLTYTLAYSPVVDMPGVTFELPRELTVTTRPGGRVSIPIAMRAMAPDMRHSRDPAVVELQGMPRHWISEEAGYLVLQPHGPGRARRLPLYVAPRRASEIIATPPAFVLGTNEEKHVEVTMAGQIRAGDARTMLPPFDEGTQVSTFLLQHSSTNELPAYIDPLLPPMWTDHADIRYVGVSGPHTVTEGRLHTDSTVYFAVATHAPWTTPKEVEVNILIDADRDGKDDYRLFNSDSVAYIFDELVSDAFVTVVEDLATNTKTIGGFLNVLPANEANTTPYNSDVMILPAPAAAIGLNEDNSRFHYRVRSYSVDVAYGVELGHFVDETPKLRFDIARPGLQAISEGMQGPIYAAVPGRRISLRLVAPNYAGTGGKGILMFYHQNLATERVQVIAVHAQGWRTVYLPLIGALNDEHQGVYK